MSCSTGTAIGVGESAAAATALGGETGALSTAVDGAIGVRRIVGTLIGVMACDKTGVTLRPIRAAACARPPAGPACPTRAVPSGGVFRAERRGVTGTLAGAATAATGGGAGAGAV
jgi:hypothetical protein